MIDKLFRFFKRNQDQQQPGSTKGSTHD